MPGKGTPKHSIRVPDEVWHAALAKARARDENLAYEIRKFLIRYAQRQDKPRRAR